MHVMQMWWFLSTYIGKS